jgi:hypothetical protein
MKRVTPVKDDWFLNHGRHGKAWKVENTRNLEEKKTIEATIRRWAQMGADFPRVEHLSREIRNSEPPLGTLGKPLKQRIFEPRNTRKARKEEPGGVWR